MKKLIRNSIAMLVVAVFMFSLSIPVSAISNPDEQNARIKTFELYRDNVQNIYINNHKSTAEPILVDGLYYVPIRIIAETLAYRCNWNEIDKSVHLENSIDEIMIYTKTGKAFLNEQELVLKGKPFLLDGRLYVPADFMQSAISMAVFYDEDSVNFYDRVILGEMNTEVFMNTDKEITVILEENASTGYVWSYTITPKEGIAFISEALSIVEISNDIVGAPQYKKWEFMTEKPGDYIIVFKYGRSFESSENDKIITYTIHVE